MKTLEERVKEELTAVDVEELYRELLDEAGTVEVAGLEFQPSRIVEELDETAFRCGVNDYFDSLSREREYEEIDGDLYDAKEVESIREEIEAEEEKEVMS